MQGHGSHKATKLNSSPANRAHIERVPASCAVLHSRLLLTDFRAGAIHLYTSECGEEYASKNGLQTQRDI